MTFFVNYMYTLSKLVIYTFTFWCSLVSRAFIYTISKLVIYTFSFWYSLVSRAFKSQIFYGMHRISNGFKILLSPMGNSFFPIQHSVHPPLPPSFLLEGGLKLLPNFQFLEGGCWERGGNFFQSRGGCNFYKWKCFLCDN